MANRPNHQTVSLSPAALAGLALRPLPPALLSPFLGLAMTVMRQQHPEVFRRLEGLGDADILIDPTDLPFFLTFRLRGGTPLLSAAKRPPPEAGAIVRGKLAVLIDLLEGRSDGDAMFFSRDLSIEGDMEAVLSLRNAVDSAEIDLAADLLSLLGPLSGPARRVLEEVRSVFSGAPSTGLRP